MHFLHIFRTFLFSLMRIKKVETAEAIRAYIRFYAFVIVNWFSLVFAVQL